MGMGEDEEEEEIERGTLNYGEHAFEFSKFEQVSFLTSALVSYR